MLRYHGSIFSGSLAPLDLVSTQVGLVLANVVPAPPHVELVFAPVGVVRLELAAPGVDLGGTDLVSASLALDDTQTGVVIVVLNQQT